MKNKYYFFKKMYKDYVVIVESKGKIKSLGYDKKLMQYIKNNDVNYILIYGDFTIKKYVCKNNNYKAHLIKSFLEETYLKA